MTTQKIAESIRLIAPKFTPDSEDLKWLESELDRVANNTLPRLIRKRFAHSLNSGVEPKNTPRREAGSPTVVKPAAVVAGVLV
jgi:hypothetical protein